MDRTFKATWLRRTVEDVWATLKTEIYFHTYHRQPPTTMGEPLLVRKLNLINRFAKGTTDKMALEAWVERDINPNTHWTGHNKDHQTYSQYTHYDLHNYARKGCCFSSDCLICNFEV